MSCSRKTSKQALGVTARGERITAILKSRVLFLGLMQTLHVASSVFKLAHLPRSGSSAKFCQQAPASQVQV